jgi:acyl dehydratase
MAINYGTNKVRFPKPVTPGSRIRAVATLASVEDVPASVQAVVRYTVEIEGQQKPALVAETVRVTRPGPRLAAADGGASGSSEREAEQ